MIMQGYDIIVYVLSHDSARRIEHLSQFFETFRIDTYM